MKETIFVLRDTRSNTGTNAMFWKKGGCYTSNLLEAEHFTHERAQRQHSCRETDVPLPLDELMALSRERIDMQCAPESSLTGNRFLIRTGNDYDGNDLQFLSSAGRTYDFNLAQVLTRDEAIKRCTTNEYYKSYRYDDLLPLVRRTVSVLPAKQDELFKAHGFILKKPEPLPPKQKFNCIECGKFIRESDYYSSCSHCNAPNY
ncbi:MAG: hypothetical protein GY833_21675 [Aestuariibacter sp.]|nr:hypothetical protein [Aestuariibacter sp.]